MKTIAVIEDTAADLELILNIFKKNKEYKVVYTAKNFEEAELLFRKAPPDIVLLDLILENKDGADLIPHIKEKWKKSIIIVVSRVEMVHKIVQCILAEAKGYLLKLDSTEVNLSRIDLAMNGQPYLSSMVKEKLAHHTLYPDDGIKKAIQDDCRLTKCEKEFLITRYEGLTEIQTAEKLHVGHDAIKKRRVSCYKKLDAAENLKEAIDAIFYGKKK